jgi:hypothetical protein
MGGLRQNIEMAMSTGVIAQTLGRHAFDEINQNYPDPKIDPANLNQR